jgi:hypothetical protein
MNLDPAQEWRQVQEVYSQMSEDELRSVAATAYELTDIARQVLAAEIRDRGIGIALVTERPRKPERPEMRSEDELLHPSLATVYVAQNAAEAQSATQKLDAAGIVWRISPEWLEWLEKHPDADKCNIDIQVLLFDRERAQSLLPPQDEDEPYIEVPEAPIVCPRCKSEGVVFDSVDQTGKYKWHCEDCGSAWLDDGVEW